MTDWNSYRKKILANKKGYGSLIGVKINDNPLIIISNRDRLDSYALTALLRNQYARWNKPYFDCIVDWDKVRQSIINGQICTMRNCGIKTLSRIIDWVQIIDSKSES